MKKLAIGCLVVLVVGCVAAAGVGYYLYRQVRSTVAQYAQLSTVPDIEREIRNTSPFTPPASDEFTEAQLERLVKIQGRIRDRLGARVTELDQNYRALMEKKEPTAFDLPKIMTAYADLASTWLEAKREQVAALNEVHLSKAEYQWIRDQAYRAIGVPLMEIDISRLVEEIQKGVANPSDPGTLRGAIGPAGSASNQKLVERFKKALEQNVGLAAFGL
jgi:hypothetical protein